MLPKILFHLIGAVHFFFGCYYDYLYVNVPGQLNFGGKFKYLTYLDAMLQTSYFIVALLNDLIGTDEPTPSEKPFIRRLKDTLFSALAFPLSMFVGLSFWGIYAVDRELIFPKSLDAHFPTWLNHIMHTNIMVFMFIELATSFRMYPKRSRGFSILSACMLCYLVWVQYIYYVTGGWVYPILKVLNWPLRITFYLFSLGLIGALYSLGENLNNCIWNKEVENTVKSGKKKAE